MKAGFTLIELMISLVITGLIGVVLTTFLNQTSTVQARLGKTIDEHTRAVIAFQQIERDAMGACMPVQNQKKKEAQTPQQGPQTEQEKQPQQAEKKEEEKVKQVEHVFYCEQSNENLKLFTVVTTNPLPVYWSKQLGKPKPKIARVVYTLKQDPENKESYTLMRQEDENLDLSSFANPTTLKLRRTGASADRSADKSADRAGVRAYEIIDGIRSMTMRFSVFKYKEETEKKEQPKDGQTAKKTAQKRERTLEERNSWDWPTEKEKKKEESESKKEEEPPFPNFVTITLALWDDKYERTTVYEYVIPIMADVMIQDDAKKEGEVTPPANEKQSANAKEPQSKGQGPSRTGQNSSMFQTKIGQPQRGPSIFAPPSFNLAQRR